MSSARRMKEVIKLYEERRTAGGAEQNELRSRAYALGYRRRECARSAGRDGYQWLRGFDEAVAEQNAAVKCRIAKEQERRDAFIEWLMRKFPEWDQ